MLASSLSLYGNQDYGKSTVAQSKPTELDALPIAFTSIANVQENQS